jgi:hypothetical protein
MTKPSDYEVNVNVNRDGLEDTLDEVNEAISEMSFPNITIRNNQVVHVTINNFNMTHEQYMKEEVKE